MDIGDKVVPIQNYHNIPAEWKELEIIGKSDWHGHYHIRCLNGDVIYHFNIDRIDIAMFEFKIKS
nr:MAG: hypothetical protein [Bacteriophage sp.]